MDQIKQEVTDLISPCVRKCVPGTLEQGVEIVMKVLGAECKTPEELSDIAFQVSVSAFFRDAIGSSALHKRIMAFIAQKKGFVWHPKKGFITL